MKTQKWSGGLTGKLIRFTVIFMLGIGVTFLVITHGLLSILGSMVEREQNGQTDLVQEETKASIAGITQNSLLSMVTWAADKIDDEFFILDHDIRVLQHQVADIMSRPEEYKTLSVEPPKKENEGKFALQLLAPGDYSDISPETMEMMGKLANLGPMMQEMVRGNEGYTLDCYIATTDGVALAMDLYSGGKYDESGKIRPYDATTRAWYQGAAGTQDVYLLAAHSHFYNFNEAIFGAPVYVDGKLVAVLQMSTRLEVIERKMSERNIGKTGFSILINPEGQLVCSSREEGELVTSEDLSGDIRDRVNPSLAKVINEALEGLEGNVITEVDGETYHAAYSTLETIGWKQIAFVSEKELHEPAYVLADKMDQSSEEMLSELRKIFNKAAILMMLVLAVLVVASILLVSALARKRVKPLNLMTDKVRKFTDSEMNFEMEDVYKTGDEIQVLAESFETMSGKMKTYVDEIVTISTEKERIDAEMAMATQIQESMLPRTFPAYPDRTEFDLYANMAPAKTVGGDFYDFFLIDEDHLALVIADVSGKGITAALFMALSKQMVQSQLLIQKGDVVSAVTAANLQLLERSLADMFVTMWVGVVTLSTGEIVYVDAGHDYPALQRGEEDYEFIKDHHSIPVAAIDLAKYHENRFTLSPGDTLYLYTDGVPEAHNKEQEMFEMDRFLAVLNETKGRPLAEIDDELRAKIAEFAGEAEQFDDITTLVFRYHGKND